MASEFPGRPRLLKGALAVFESQTPGARPAVIVFQYNPESLKRTLATRAPPSEPGNAGAAREDVTRVMGPPVETINLTVVLDAADQLERPLENAAVVASGLHPALATLEMLLYPPTSKVSINQALSQQGEVQIAPDELPLTLLVWGASRVVPVLVTGFSVSEEAFDPALNPTTARVELGMRVLTYMELKPDSIGRDVYMAYQRQKETLAGLAQPGDVARRALSGILPF
jgi:hypothetical protein